MQTGEQKRTIMCACGFVCKGDIRTANFKLKLHNKICNLSKLNNLEIPKFDNNSALQNAELKYNGSNKRIISNTINK
jgi:hypothetical protein